METYTVELLAARAVSELRRVSQSASVGLNRRSAVMAALYVEDLLRDLRVGDSGRAVIREMLNEASPNGVSARELRHASGIQEFARRIRELREEGLEILAEGDSYRLVGRPDDGS